MSKNFEIFTDTSKLKFNERGLIPTIVQDEATKEILMMAWMNAKSFQLTLEKKRAYFWSRSRQELWLKGATSGNFMNISKILIDCDADTLLLLVKPAGSACHTGARSCFYREVESRK
ncbi:MAG: phosphoribosyl-AMP cyclohydrolase [Anaerolineae bacterium]|jgi:phosphoribosyl-AMP cyclohydrolase|nr:phosphoribosyl-AMP cyclohydrolase [Anaerolineae bacterium]MBT3714165.1 phosphoribosyl-AMP cyclohydrolase [Anaerolineae bacterium]MBT4309372.1 phosphoribosyl-AMP cyclohydrolase [Anaerolineae bacterium]MBT4459220.1 phosphoribosyl-AMP cyclohydrolase [Anaerolineae bacterium]MBT6061414.1 phosphoribosyl-AMP cyclohydrolase [Anaerolineae bacterium]